MTHIIFINYKLLKNYSNIEVIFNKPKNEKKLKNIGKEERYITIINTNNLYYLFYKDKPSKKDKLWTKINYYSGDQTYLEIGDDPFNFKNKQKIVKDPIISHNIVPFIDKDNIKLIGGLHLTKEAYNSRIKLKEHDIFINYNNQYIVNSKQILKNIKCNGIYLLNHENNKFNLNSNLPIINGTNKGLIDKRNNWNISEFDGRSIIVYFKNKYYIYVRCNYKEAKGSVGFSTINKKTKVKGGGVRAVQYSISSNLVDWSEFKFININFDFNKDNIYFFGVQKYTDNILVSTFPYSNGYEGYIGISYSYDGINWTNIKKLIKSYISKSNTDRVVDFNIHHILEYKDELLFYVHRNYIWWENRKNNPYISYLSLPKDRLTCLYSKDGYFSIELKNVNNLAINYKIENEGYIKVQIENDDNYTFDKFNKLIDNDSLYTLLKWNNNIFNSNKKLTVEFKLINSYLYSIYY